MINLSQVALISSRDAWENNAPFHDQMPQPFPALADDCGQKPETG
jgi:hypothetical protein